MASVGIKQTDTGVRVLDERSAAGQTQDVLQSFTLETFHKKGEPLDLAGFQIINAGPATSDAGTITLAQLREIMRPVLEYLERLHDTYEIYDAQGQRVEFQAPVF